MIINIHSQFVPLIIPSCKGFYCSIIQAKKCFQSLKVKATLINILIARGQMTVCNVDEPAENYNRTLSSAHGVGVALLFWFSLSTLINLASSSSSSRRRTVRYNLWYNLVNIVEHLAAKEPDYFLRSCWRPRRANITCCMCQVARNVSAGCCVYSLLRWPQVAKEKWGCHLPVSGKWHKSVDEITTAAQVVVNQTTRYQPDRPRHLE